MLVYCLLAYALVVSPPRVKTCFGGSGDWEMHAIDDREGLEVVNAFYKSYEEVGNVPDFTRDMRIATGVPQLFLALSKYENIKAVLNVHNYGTRLQVTSIATPAEEYEVAKVLFDIVNKIDMLDIDVIELQRRQPRWLLTYHYYKGDVE